MINLLALGDIPAADERSALHARADAREVQCKVE